MDALKRIERVEQPYLDHVRAKRDSDERNCGSSPNFRGNRQGQGALHKTILKALDKFLSPESSEGKALDKSELKCQV